jgi:hypothetical protein
MLKYKQPTNFFFNQKHMPPIEGRARIELPPRKPKAQREQTLENNIERRPAKEYAAQLNQMMENISVQVNQELKENHGTNVDILDKNATINISAFNAENGGPYSADEIAADQKIVHDKEMEFSGADDADLRALRIKEYKIDTKGLSEEQVNQKIIEKFKRLQSEGKSGLLEMAITGLLHKVLKSEYIVVRSSSFDDFEHGADNLIMDKVTGQVVCAFDEVHGEETHGRIEEKKKKLLRKARQGGSKIKHGLSLQTDKKDPQKKNLVRGTLNNIPSLYLALDSNTLDELLNNMNYDPSSAPTATELKVFDQLMKLVDSEITTISEESRDVSSFKNALNRMRETRSKITV